MHACILAYLLKYSFVLATLPPYLPTYLFPILQLHTSANKQIHFICTVVRIEIHYVSHALHLSKQVEYRFGNKPCLHVHMLVYVYTYDMFITCTAQSCHLCHLCKTVIFLVDN